MKDSITRPRRVQHGQAVQTCLQASRGLDKFAGIGIYSSAFDPAPTRGHIQTGFRLILVGGDEFFLNTECCLVLESLSSEGG